MLEVGARVTIKHITIAAESPCDQPMFVPRNAWGTYFQQSRSPLIIRDADL